MRDKIRTTPPFVLSYSEHGIQKIIDRLDRIDFAVFLNCIAIVTYRPLTAFMWLSLLPDFHYLLVFSFLLPYFAVI